MAHASHRLILPAFLALLLAQPLRVHAGLSTDSPFMPISASQASGPGPVQNLEFRGILEMDGVDYFNIANLATKKSAWVRLNQTGAPFAVKSHEVTPVGDVVSVEQGGQLLRLTMIRPKTTNAPLVVNPAAGPRGPVFPVVLNPTAADEARRMEAFAAEVRRRRLLRQQQAEQQRRVGQQGLKPGGAAP